MSALDNERRTHDDLRDMTDKACAGLLEPVANRIKDAVRRAYYLGARDGIETARTNNDRNLAEKTIANCKELVEASKQPEPDDQVDKQRLYVARSLDRCKRCGDHVFPILPTPPLSLLCGSCETIAKSTDGVMWFAQLLAEIDRKHKEGETS